MAVSAETKTEAKIEPVRPVADDLITPTQDEANQIKAHAILGREAKAEDDELPPPVEHDPPAPSQAEANEIKVQSALGGMDVSAPVNVDVPALGPAIANVGDTLTVTMGNWDMQPTAYGYQWFKDGASETSVGGDTYVVGPGDAGCSITCVVTASNAIGSTSAPPSNAVAIPAQAARAAPEHESPHPAPHSPSHSSPAERAGPPTRKP